jgi:hypothetical protein
MDAKNEPAPGYENVQALPDLSIIIVSWNTCALVKECLASIDLFREGDVSIQVIVVDNNSADGTVEMVRSEFPTVELIANRENKGFVGGNNQAVPRARGRYLLLLNSDARLVGPGMKDIVDYMDEHPRVAIVAGKILNADGSFQRPFRQFPGVVGSFFRHTTRLIRGFDTPWHRRYTMSGVDGEHEHDVDWLSGAYLYVRKNLLENQKLFDDDIFMFYEDTLLCYQMRSRGFLVRYLPISPVVHYYHGSAKKDQVRTMHNSFRGGVVFFQKTRGKRMAFLYESAVKAAWRFFYLLFALFGFLPEPHIRKKRDLFKRLLGYANAKPAN